MEESINTDIFTDPLLAVVGAVDLMIVTLSNLINTLRERTSDACDEASHRVEASRAQLAKIQEGLSGHITHLKGRLSSEEFRKLAENCRDAAGVYYNELTVRGAAAWERMRDQIDVDQASEKLEKYLIDHTNESAQEIVNHVVHQTREVTKRTAQIVGELSDETVADVKETVAEVKETVADVKEAVADVKETVTEAKESNTEAKKALTEAKESNTEAQETIAEAKEAVAEAKEAVAEAKETVAEAKETVAEVKEAETKESNTEIQKTAVEAKETTSKVTEPVVEPQKTAPAAGKPAPAVKATHPTKTPHTRVSSTASGHGTGKTSAASPVKKAATPTKRTSTTTRKTSQN